MDAGWLRGWKKDERHAAAMSEVDRHEPTGGGEEEKKKIAFARDERESERGREGVGG